MISIKQRPLISGQTTGHALSTKPTVTTWIYGAGTFGRDVAAALHAQGKEVAGFIELHPRQTNAWGYPVRALADCCPRPQHEQVLVAVFNRLHPLSKIQQDLQDFGFDQVLMPWDYYGQLADQLGWRYWLEDSQFLRRHQGQLERVICLVDGNPNLHGKKMDQFTIEPPQQLEQHPDATVVISSYGSQESIAKSLAQSWPNAICRLYPCPTVLPNPPAEAVTADASA